MKKLSFFLLICFLVSAVTQCTNDPFPPRIVEKPLAPTDTIDTSNAPDPDSPNVTCHPDTSYFEKDVLPIILANCANACHNPNGPNNGIILTDYDQIIDDGKVRAGEVDESDLYELITETDPDKRMPPPPNAALSSEDIAKIRTWIEQGALNNTCDFDTAEAVCSPQNVSFASEVSSILTDYGCIGCHSGGTVILNTYAGAKEVADDGRLIGSIMHETGYKAMPQGGNKMDSCDIVTIETWISEGTLNN